MSVLVSSNGFICEHEAKRITARQTSRIYLSFIKAKKNNMQVWSREGGTLHERKRTKVSSLEKWSWSSL